MKVNILISLLFSCINFFYSATVREILSHTPKSSEEIVYLASFFGGSFIFIYLMVYLVRKAMKK